jgi:hypothetical protein
MRKKVHRPAELVNDVRTQYSRPPSCSFVSHSRDEVQSSPSTASADAPTRASEARAKVPGTHRKRFVGHPRETFFVMWPSSACALRTDPLAGVSAYSQVITTLVLVPDPVVGQPVGSVTVAVSCTDPVQLVGPGHVNGCEAVPESGNPPVA